MAQQNTIRRVEHSDLQVLEEISRSTFYDTFNGTCSDSDMSEFLLKAYNSKILEKELSDPLSEFYFILSSDKPAGYLKLNTGAAQTESKGSDYCEIQRVYILPEFKRQGLGQDLIDLAVLRAKELKKKYIWLGVWEHNYSAQTFYQKNGFIPSGKHNYPIGDTLQIDLILEKNLKANL